MRIRKLAAAAALGLAAVGLSACATGLRTQVSRYQPAAIPAGASFYVVPKQGTPDPQFYRYASMVSQRLQAQGFRPAGAPQAADVLVRVDYGVDEGKTEVVSDPPFYGSRYGRYGGGFGYRDPFFDPFWGVYYGRPYWSSWSRFPYYYGWDDPFWYGGYGGYGGYGYGGGIREYTVYKSYLDMDIVRRADNAPLFEGHAKARSQSDELDALVPNLVQAMFTGFPGKNGETVKITVPSTKR
ncbi:MAG: DUF4136 domain-containing protein [Sphingomicrobium sp.]